MRVLVTGANGFLGGNLVRQLLQDGAFVRVMVRSAEKGQTLASLGAEVLVGDVTDGGAFMMAASDVHIIYHLAGRLFSPGIPMVEYERTHVAGTRTLLSVCQGLRQLKRLVYCSTTGVLGVTGDRPANEDSPPAPTNAYEATKWEGEKLVQESIARGLPAVIVRPGLVYGPGDLHLLGFFRMIQRAWFRPIGKRAVWLHPVYIDDLNAAMLRCAEHQNAVGECLHIAGQEPVTIAALARAIALTLGAPPARGFIPFGIAKVLATAGDLLPPKLKPLAPLTSSRLDFLTNSRIYDVSKASRILGFEAPTDLSTGLARTALWYRSQGYLPVPKGRLTKSVGI